MDAAIAINNLDQYNQCMELTEPYPSFVILNLFQDLARGWPGALLRQRLGGLPAPGFWLEPRWTLKQVQGDGNVRVS